MKMASVVRIRKPFSNIIILVLIEPHKDLFGTNPMRLVHEKIRKRYGLDSSTYSLIWNDGQKIMVVADNDDLMAVSLAAEQRHMELVLTIMDQLAAPNVQMLNDLAQKVLPKQDVAVPNNHDNANVQLGVTAESTMREHQAGSSCQWDLQHSAKKRRMSDMWDYNEMQDQLQDR